MQRGKKLQIPVTVSLLFFKAMKKESLLSIIPLIPIVVLIFTIVLNWVNIPYTDEWGLSIVFDRFYSHTLSLDFLFSQHNEHRMFLPRLVLIANGLLTHWDVRIQMLLTVLLVVLISGNCHTLLKKVEVLSFRSRIFLMTVINMILFSLVQSENWLFGMQFAFYIPPLMITTALIINSSTANFSVKLLGSAVLSIISSLSISFGLIAWFLSFPYSDLTKRLFFENKKISGKDILHSVFYGAAAFFIIALYFHHYEKPLHHPPLSYALVHPIEAVTYFFIWCGASLTPSPKFTFIVASLVGGAFLLTFLCTLYSVFSRLIKRDERIFSLYPWCMMGLYSVICGIFSTFGRVGIGVEQAFSSRYIAISSYLPISVAVIIFSLNALNNHRDIRRLRNLLAILTVAFVILYSAGFCKALKNIATHKKDLLEGIAALSLSSACPDNYKLEKLYFHEKENLLNRFHALYDFHLVSVRELNGQRILESLSVITTVGNVKYGRIEECELRSSSQLFVRGWVSLISGAAPVIVMLVFTDDRGVSKPFTTVLMDRKAKNGAAVFSDTIDMSDIPQGHMRISAWVIGGKESRAFQCGGTFRIEKL